MNSRQQKQTLPNKNGTPQTNKSAKDKFTYNQPQKQVSSNQVLSDNQGYQQASQQNSKRKEQMMAGQQQLHIAQSNQELRSKRSSHYQQPQQIYKDQEEFNQSPQHSEAQSSKYNQYIQPLSRQKSQKVSLINQANAQENTQATTTTTPSSLIQKQNPTRDTKTNQTLSGQKQNHQQINRITNQVQPLKQHKNRVSMVSQESQGPNQKSQKNTPAQQEQRIFEYREEKKTGGNTRARAKNYSQFSNERNINEQDMDEEVTYRDGIATAAHQELNIYQNADDEEDNFEVYGNLLLSQQNPLQSSGQSSQIEQMRINKNKQRIQNAQRGSDKLLELGASRETHQRPTDRLKKSSTTAYLNYNQQTQGQIMRRNLENSKGGFQGGFLENQISQNNELVSVSSRGSDREKKSNKNAKVQSNNMKQSAPQDILNAYQNGQSANTRHQPKKDRLSLGSINHQDEGNTFDSNQTKQHIAKLSKKQSLLSPIRSQQVNGQNNPRFDREPEDRDIKLSISEVNQDSEEVVTMSKSNERRQLKNLRQGRLDQNQDKRTVRLENNALIQSITQRQDDRIDSSEAQYRNANPGLHRLSSLSKDREYDRESLINYRSGKNSKMEERLEERAQKIKQRLQNDQRRIIQIEDNNQSRIQSTSNLPSLGNPQIMNSKGHMYKKRQSNQSYAESSSHAGFNQLSNQVHDLLVQTPLSHFQKPQQAFLHRNNSIDQNLDVSSRNLNQRRQLKSIADPSLESRAEQNQYLKENFSVRNLRNQYKSNDSQIYSRGTMRKGLKREDLQTGNATTVNQRIKQRMNGSMDSFDNFGDATGIVQNIPDEDIQEDDEPMLAGSQDSRSHKKVTKLQTQYRINLPKVNKKGLQIIINKDQTQTIVGNIQKLNHKFQNQTVKLESILPNSSQTISKRNFERNLKNANEEIIRLRQELNEKNKLLEKIAQTEIRSQRVERSDIQSNSQMRDTIGMSMGQPKSMTRGDNQTQLMPREYSLSGLEMNSERKSTDNTFRVRKINLKRQNTEQELQRANSQPILISRRNIIFKPDEQQDHQDELQFRSQTNLHSLNKRNIENEMAQSKLLETSDRLSSAQMLPNITGDRAQSQQQTPVHKQGTSSLNPLNSSLNMFDQNPKLSQNDPRIRKYKQNVSPFDQLNKNPTTSSLKSSHELQQLKLQIQSSQNQANTIKTADLDVLEERDELEEDGDKLTREGFFQNQDAFSQQEKVKTIPKRAKNKNSSDQTKKSTIVIQSSNQGLTNSQFKSTGVALNKNGSEWGISSTQTKFQSISTPSNMKQKTNKVQDNGIQTNKKIPAVQTENRGQSLAKIIQNSTDSNEDQDDFIYEDEEELINPVNDEISPQHSIEQRNGSLKPQSLIDSFKPDSFQINKMYETPKRGFPKLQQQQVKVKSSFELLQEIQKNETKQQQAHVRNSSNSNSRDQKQDSPSFGQNIVDLQSQTIEPRAFEYQVQAKVADFGMLTMTDLSKAMNNQESANNQFTEEVQQASIPSNQQNSSPMPNPFKDLQQLQLNQQPSLDAQAKRFQVFYEDDIDDEYAELNSSPEQEPRGLIGQEDFECDSPIKYQVNDDLSYEEQLEDGSTPQIFAETLYQQNTQGNKFIQFEKQLQNKQGDGNEKDQISNPFLVSAAQSEDLKESMDFVGSLRSARLQSKNENNDPLNIRSSQAYLMERNSNLRASAIRYSSKDSQIDTYQSNQLKMISERKQPRKLPYVDEEEELCQYQYSNSMISSSMMRDKNEEMNQFASQQDQKQVQEFILDDDRSQLSFSNDIGNHIKQQEGHLELQF